MSAIAGTKQEKNPRPGSDVGWKSAEKPPYNSSRKMRRLEAYEQIIFRLIRRKRASTTLGLCVSLAMADQAEPQRYMVQVALLHMSGKAEQASQGGPARKDSQDARQRYEIQVAPLLISGYGERIPLTR